MTTPDIDQKKKDLKNKWTDKFEQLGETEVVKLLGQHDISEVLQDDFFTELESTVSDKKTLSYLESMRDDVKDEIGFKDSDLDDFPYEKYKDLDKYKIVQKMVEYTIYQNNILPVDTGIGQEQNQIRIFRYVKDEGYWDALDSSTLGTTCNQLAPEIFNTYIRNEFIAKLRHHTERTMEENFGLPEHEILINNKRVLDLHTRTTREVETDDGAIYKVQTDFKPDADCPKFRNFIDNLFDGDEEQIKTAQEFCGWLLKYPNSDYDKALMILGVSNSGKTQFLKCIASFFNERATANISVGQLGFHRRFHVDKLGDSIVNFDGDMGHQEIKSVDTLKQVISQEKIAAEPKGEDTVEVEPSAKFFICSNVAPNPESDSDAAFYNRFLTLKAPNEVPKSEREFNFGKKLFVEEKEGIFNWMLDGLERLEEQGEFTYSPSAYETKVSWNEYGDSVQRFMWECAEPTDSDDFIPTEDLYEEYELWIEDKLMETEGFSEFVRKVQSQPYVHKSRRLVDGSKRSCAVGFKLDNPASGSI